MELSELKRVWSGSLPTKGLRECRLLHLGRSLKGPGTSILSLKSCVVGQDPFHIERIWDATLRRPLRDLHLCPRLHQRRPLGHRRKNPQVPIYRLLEDPGIAFGLCQHPELQGHRKLCRSSRIVGPKEFTAIKLHPWRTRTVISPCAGRSARPW